MTVPFMAVEEIVKMTFRPSLDTEDKKLAAFVIEFDDLSRFNYLIGHDIDELILKKLHGKIYKILPHDGVVGRIGTYRFAFLLFIPSKDAKHIAKKTADTVIDLLKEPLNIKEHMFYVTASIGISLADSSSSAPYYALKEAENAMRQIRKEGKNYIAFASRHCSEESLQRELFLLKSLPQGLDNDEFFFLYQPQYNPRTCRFEGAEILARWKHPELGIISPGEFIPLAEKSGMIIPLTLRLLTDAAETFAKLEQMGLNDFSIAVNIAPDMLLEQSFIENTSLLLDAYDLKSRPLTFEIMEDTVVSNFETFVTILQKLKEMGVHIALDDYGTGHTSFHYLLHLPIDTLKIDRTFIQGVDRDRKRYILLRSIMEMATAMSFKIVAEGVETEEEEKCISELGECMMQGFRFAAPMSKNEMFRMLEEHMQD